MKKYVNKFKDFLLNESSLAKIYQRLKDSNGQFGVISGFRKTNTKEVNEENHKELRTYAKEHGFGYIELRGGFVENENEKVIEKSLFLNGISEKELFQLANKYEQESVLFKNSDKFAEINPKDGTIIKSFDKNSFTLDMKIIQDYYSRLLKGSHRNKKFLFEELESNSFNRAAYHREEPLKWFTIYEDI